jgi:hypothetical protein
VNLPEGTTQQQAKEVAQLVETKLQESDRRSNLETLNAIGAY